MDKLEWSALEYEEKDRSSDWFWALGVIIITGAIASIIFSNYFFAALLILGGILLAYFAVKKPDTVDYELNEKGLQIRTRLYPYDTMKSFWVQNGLDEAKPTPMLFVKTDRPFLPMLTVHIDTSLAHQIEEIMISKNVIPEEMEEHLAEKIMDYLGF